jgi:hypothetical protein
MIKSGRMRWAGHVARTGKKRKHTVFCWESQKENTTRKKCVGGRIKIKWILDGYYAAIIEL